MPNRRASPLHMVLAALFCALAAVLAQIQIPLPAVPISLTTLAVYLCGALLPPRYAAASMLCYALLGAVGLWLVICIAASVAAASLTAGANWLRWAAKYSTMTAVGCLLGCGIPLARACGANLVKSYQSREGE